jgi:hypothetical protein
MRGVLPDTALLADGSAGFLVNLVPSGRPARIDDMPFGPVDIVALTLLTPPELDQLRTGGAAGASHWRQRVQRPEGMCRVCRDLQWRGRRRHVV